VAARVETEWTYLGLQVLRVENEFLRLDILPELGAKIFNLIHKEADRNVLCHSGPTSITIGLVAGMSLSLMVLNACTRVKCCRI
jgi:hypothetical protein